MYTVGAMEMMESSAVLENGQQDMDSKPHLFGNLSFEKLLLEVWKNAPLLPLRALYLGGENQ